MQTERRRQPAPDSNAPARIKTFKATENDVVGDERQSLKPLLRDAAHDTAERLRRRGQHHLAFDQRHDGLHARRRCQALRKVRVIVERSGSGHLVDDDVPVEAKDLLEELIAEAVHDGHHDDQRGNTEQDADEREARDDGDETFLAPGAQVTQCQHPLEWRERPGIDLRAHPVC